MGTWPSRLGESQMRHYMQNYIYIGKCWNLYSLNDIPNYAIKNLFFSLYHSHFPDLTFFSVLHLF
jgi:hypothetical protein